MISKTFVAVALAAGLASSGAIAAPKKNSAASERAATRQLNEQQLALAGSVASTPATPGGYANESAPQPAAPASGDPSAPVTAPAPDPAAPPVKAPSAPPQ